MGFCYRKIIRRKEDTMKILLRIITILVCAAHLVSAQESLLAEKYLKVKPTISTREDVERLYGKEPVKHFYALYETKDAIIEIEYSEGDCDTDDYKWSVPKWVVKEVDIFFKDHTKIRINDVIEKRSSFTKRQEGDVLNHIYYSNSDRSIVVIYDKQSKIVEGIILLPTKEQIECHRCKKTKQ